jgi:DNA-binding MarR family transcriptional regulator
MDDLRDPLAIMLFSELFTADQLARNRFSKLLPKGMELSHFSVLNHLASLSNPRTPAQLAKTFHLTRGAMTNTLSKLEWAGYVHVNPDWDDARRKQVVISPAGRAARDSAMNGIEPIIAEIVEAIGTEKVRQTVPVLRELRRRLQEND